MKTVVVPSTTTTSSSSSIVVVSTSTGTKTLSSSSSEETTTNTTTTTTSLLRKIGRRGNGLKKRIVEASKRSFNCSSTTGGSGDAANDVSVDETLGLSSIDEEDDDDTRSINSRTRRVKFTFPEVTDVQTSYRVPHQDKYKFYYTKENIAFFKREYDIERTPTCGQAMQDSFWNAMWNFSGSSSSSPSTSNTRSPRSKYLSGGTNSTRLSSRSPNHYNFPSICYEPCSNGYFESPPRYTGVFDLGPLAITNQGTPTDNSRTTSSNTTTGILRLRNQNTMAARRINYDDDKENLDITAAFEREYVSCSSRMGFGCRPLH